MLVIGVDPGSRVCGFGLVAYRDGCLCHCHDEELRLPARATVAAKLSRLYEQASLLMEQFKPQHLAVEGVFFGRNVKSMLVLGQARGAVLVAGARQGLEIYEYAPAAVKQAVSGYGKADKEQVERMVKSLLGVDALSGEHAADALAVAICHLHTDPRHRELL